MTKKNHQTAHKIVLSLHFYLLLVVVGLVMFFVVKNYHNYQHTTKQPRQYAIELLVNYSDQNFDNVLRERKESAIYVLSVLCTTLVGFLSLFFSRNLPKFLSQKSSANIYSVVTAINILLAFVLCYFALTPGNTLDLVKDTIADFSLFFVTVCTIFLAAATVFYHLFYHQKFDRIWQFAAWFIVILFSAWIASYGVFDKYSWAVEVGSVNFDFVADPIIQQHLGNNALVDFRSYYGLYPYFLQPFLSFLPPTILAMTLLLSSLFLIALLAIFALILGLTANRLLALIGFTALIFMQNFIATPALRNGALIFQYEAIRLLCPSLLLLFLMIFYRQPSSQKYWFILIFAALATIWNLDSGLPTFVTVAIVLGHEKTKQNFALRKLLCHIFNCVVTLFCTWLLFAFYVKLRSNFWPNFSWILFGQKAAYDYAIAMMPAEACGMWWAFALVYLIGLLLSIDNFLRKNHSLQNTMILALTVLGVGLMSYFVGRSVINNLFHSGYPALILLIIFADRFVDYIKLHGKKIHLDAIIFAVPLLLICFFTTAFFCNFSRGFFTEKTAFFTAISENQNNEIPYWIDEVKFIQKYIGSTQNQVRDDVLLLADNNQNYYFDLELKTRSIMPSLNVREIFYQEDFAAISQLITSKKQQFVILVLSQNKEVPPSMSLAETNSLQKLLIKHYQLLVQNNFGPDDTVQIYQSQK